MNQLICYTFIDNLQDSCVSWNCTFVYTDDSATGYSRQTAALSQFLNLIYPPCMNSLVAQKQNEKEMGANCDLNDYSSTYRQKKVSPYESSDSLLSYTELPSWLHGASLLSDVDPSFRWQEAKDSTEAGISLLWSSQTTCGRIRVRMCVVIFFLFFLFPLLVCVCSADFCLFLNEPSLLLRPPFFCTAGSFR